MSLHFKRSNYFNNLNPKVITDNKKFWSAVKPLFSDKSKAMNTIVLYEKGKIVKSYKRISDILNKYFTNLTKSLKLKKCTSRKSFLNTSIKKINQVTLSKKLSLSVKFVKLKH